MAGVYENDQIGKREDLSDYIYNIDVRNTPFLSRVRKGKKLERAVFDFQMESYPQPRTGGVQDGVDASAWERIHTRKLAHGVAQKFWRLPFVSDFAENVSNVAGVRSEMARETKGALTMLKRDMEARFCASALECSVDNGDAAYATRSLGLWLDDAAQALYPVDASFRPPTAQNSTTASGSLTEAIFKTIGKSQWTQSGAVQDYELLVGAAVKGQISTFTSYAASGITDLRRVTGKAGELALMVDVIRNDFATYRTHLSPFISADTAYGEFRWFALDMSMIEVRYNRAPRVVPQEYRGGGDKAIVDAIAGLAVYNPKAMAKGDATS